MQLIEKVQIIEHKLNAILSLLESAGAIATRKMLDTDEAASYLGISLSTLYKHTSSGNIPYYKPNGKLILFNKQDLEDWIETKRIPSNKELSNQ